MVIRFGTENDFFIINCIGQNVTNQIRGNLCIIEKFEFGISVNLYFDKDGLLVKTGFIDIFGTDRKITNKCSFIEEDNDKTKEFIEFAKSMFLDEVGTVKQIAINEDIRSRWCNYEY